MNSFIKYNWPSILWAAFILVLCLLPGKDMPSISLFEIDKIGHFFVYTVLAYLMWYGWKKQAVFPALQKNAFVKILLITSVYGFGVEVLQEMFTADRHFDILDALANTGGAVAGSLTGLYFKE